MLLRFGTICRSRGEGLGTLHGVTVEPSEKLLLNVIVEEPQAAPLVRTRIPFGRIDHADRDQVAVGMPAAEFRALGVRDPTVGRAGGQGRRRRGDEPTGILLTARTRIECRDGEVGRLAAIVVDSRTGDVEAIVVPVGMPLTRDLVIGVEHVSDLRDDRLGLDCNLNDLADF